jgi:hypothetical protein
METHSNWLSGFLFMNSLLKYLAHWLIWPVLTMCRALDLIPSTNQPTLFLQFYRDKIPVQQSLCGTHIKAERKLVTSVTAWALMEIETIKPFLVTSADVKEKLKVKKKKLEGNQIFS